MTLLLNPEPDDTKENLYQILAIVSGKYYELNVIYF